MRNKYRVYVTYFIGDVGDEDFKEFQGEPVGFRSIAEARAFANGLNPNLADAKAAAKSVCDDDEFRRRSFGWIYWDGEERDDLRWDRCGHIDAQVHVEYDRPGGWHVGLVRHIGKVAYEVGVLSFEAFCASFGLAPNPENADTAGGAQ